MPLGTIEHLFHEWMKGMLFPKFLDEEKGEQIPSFWMKTLRGRDEGLKVIQKYFDILIPKIFDILIPKNI